VPLLGGPPKSGLLGDQPYDDLSLGKRYCKAGNYGLAERYFRRAETRLVWPL
jgi:hypothetical protein